MERSIINFHTFIRRYCIDRSDMLKSIRLDTQLKTLGIYEKSMSMTEEQVVHAIYQRIKSLSREEAIKIENDPTLRKNECSINIDILEITLENIEKIDPLLYKNLNSIKNICSHMIQSSKLRGNTHYHGWSEKEKEKIIDTERSQLISLINETDEDDLTDVPPLFFRRVLSEDMEKSLLFAIKKKWHEKVEQKSSFSNKDYLLIHENQFKKVFNQEKIIQTPLQRGEKRIYQLNPWELKGVSYQMDTHLILTNPKTELYWCSDKLDWAIIKDHEDHYHIWGDCFLNTTELFHSDLNKNER